MNTSKENLDVAWHTRNKMYSISYNNCVLGDYWKSRADENLADSSSFIDSANKCYDKSNALYKLAISTWISAVRAEFGNIEIKWIEDGRTCILGNGLIYKIGS